MEPKNEKIVYQGKMIEIVQETVMMPSGKEKIFEQARRAPGVRLIIHTPDNNFLISKEQRRNIGVDYRLPGGKVFDSLIEYNTFLSAQKDPKEIFEAAKEAAIKEGMEESGIKPTEIELFCKSLCGGSMEWDLYYFIITKYEEVGQDPEDGEKIEVMKVSREELKELALSGEMQEDRSVAVILKYLNNH